MTEQQQLRSYLESLDGHLRRLPRPVRGEIVREIAAHIRDAAEAPGTTMATMLARLGPPEPLAREYADQALFRQASRSLSPAVLLRAAVRLASRGILGVLVSVLALFGYALGGGFVLCSLGKLLFPAHTGLWVQDGHLVSTGALIVVPPPPAHEVLGWSYLPIALVTGAVLLVLTTLAIRLCLRLSRQWQARLTAGLPFDAQPLHGHG